MPIYVPDEQGELTALDQVTLGVAQATSTMPASDPGNLGAAFGKMILSLIAVVVLLLVSYWFLKRLVQNRLQKGVGDAAIQIIEKRMISPKTVLYLIEVDHKRILVAESHLEIKRLEGFEIGDSRS